MVWFQAMLLVAGLVVAFLFVWLSCLLIGRYLGGFYARNETTSRGSRL